MSVTVRWLQGPVVDVDSGPRCPPFSINAQCICGSYGLFFSTARGSKGHGKIKHGCFFNYWFIFVFTDWHSSVFFCVCVCKAACCSVSWMIPRNDTWKTQNIVKIEPHFIVQWYSLSFNWTPYQTYCAIRHVTSWSATLQLSQVAFYYTPEASIVNTIMPNNSQGFRLPIMLIIRERTNMEGAEKNSLFAAWRFHWQQQKKIPFFSESHFLLIGYLLPLLSPPAHTVKCSKLITVLWGVAKQFSSSGPFSPITWSGQIMFAMLPWKCRFPFFHSFFLLLLG